jgi:hypothetical protein
MASSGTLRRVALVRIDVSEELSASIIRVQESVNYEERFVPSSTILVTLMIEALSSFETSVPIRATRRNIPEESEESVTRTPAQGKQDTPQQKQYKVQHQEKTKNSKQQPP